MKKACFIFAILLVVFCCFGASQVFASTKDKSFKEATVDVGKAVVNYPANLLNESVNAVGNTAKNTADVAVDTVKVTGETLSGDVEKTPEIVKTPVVGSAKTVNDAVVETVEAPVRAGETAKEQMN